MKKSKKELIIIVLAAILVSVVVAFLSNFLMGGISGTDDSFIPYINLLW